MCNRASILFILFCTCKCASILLILFCAPQYFIYFRLVLFCACNCISIWPQFWNLLQAVLVLDCGNTVSGKLYYTPSLPHFFIFPQEPSLTNANDWGSVQKDKFLCSWPKFFYFFQFFCRHFLHGKCLFTFVFSFFILFSCIVKNFQLFLN